MMRKNHTERGQAVVLMVLGVVVLLGFTALAIDGGMLYADRRHAQDGADAASWAGAGGAAGYLKYAADNGIDGGAGEDWQCANTVVSNAIQAAKTEAVANAANNGFTISPTNDFSAIGNIVAVHCEEVNGHYLDVRVSITLNTQTALAHFVYNGPTQNTVDAVTRVYAREPVGLGQSIITLDDDCNGQDKGTRFTGGGGPWSTINIEGGIYSKSCIVASGNVTVTTGAAVYDQTFDYTPTTEGMIIEEPIGIADNLTIDIPTSPCVGPENPTPDAGNYFPGIYTDDISATNGQTITLNPGMYCFKKENDQDQPPGLKITGGTITGNGVTFYFYKDAGGFSITGSGVNNLSAPVEPCDPNVYGNVDCSPAIPNILIYVEKPNASSVAIEGNTLSTYSGVVYAPLSLVSIGGTTANTTPANASMQVIANSVKVHGTATLNMLYNDSMLYHTPNFMNLQK